MSILSKAYCTAVYAYYPPGSSPDSHHETAKDAQTIQTALGQLINHVRQSIISRRKGKKTNPRNEQPSTSRWFLQIRTLRLAVPQLEGSQISNSTRTMYMTRYASHPDSVTLVIEDPARSAVNISTLASGSFDHFLSSNLLPSQIQTASGSSQQAGRWIPRPSYCQIEGAVIHDAEADFRISIGMISTRGGASGSNNSVAGAIVLQVWLLFALKQVSKLNIMRIARLSTNTLLTVRICVHARRIPFAYSAQLRHDPRSFCVYHYRRLEKLAGITSTGRDRSDRVECSQHELVFGQAVQGDQDAMSNVGHPDRIFVMERCRGSSLPLYLKMQQPQIDKASAIHIQVSDPSVLAIPLCASTFGFVSGLLTAAQRASLQFLAENAHRQPTTLQGWYFYNKTKNYRVALAGFKGGLVTAGRLGGWTTGYVFAKHACSSIGGGMLADYQAGALSGGMIALTASALYRLPKRTLGRRLVLGLALGLVAGGLQDARNWVRSKQAQLADGRS